MLVIMFWKALQGLFQGNPKRDLPESHVEIIYKKKHNKIKNDDCL